MSDLDPRPTIDSPDDDPYLWLEDIEGAAPLEWVEQQNAKTLARFATPQFAADRDTLAAILDRPDKIPYVTRRGGLLYNFWRDADHPRGLWRRTTMEEFRKDEPSWEVLLDLDALAAAEGEDWVWHGASTLLPSHERAMVYLSRGGSDANVLREFGLSRKGFIENGFHVPEAKGHAEWLDVNTLLLMSAHGGEPMQTRSGYARTVRLWKRGTDPLSAPVLFEVPESHMAAGAFVDRTARTERIWFIDRPSFFENEYWIGGRNGPETKLDLPSDAWIGFHGDWCVLKSRSPWTVGGVTHAPDTLLGGSVPAILKGERDFTILFEPGERIALQHFFWCGRRLVLSILDNLEPRYDLLLPGASGWQRSALGGLPAIGVVSAGPLDLEEVESNGELIVVAEDMLTPSTLSVATAETAPAILKRAPAVFDAGGLVITRHEAVSIDGECIPYVQAGPSAETGDAPVLMTGYGGFGLAEQPYYVASVGKLWLERGGTFVLAHLRGGGEFGTRWHDAGRREGKRLAHDDFAAIAADLVRRGITRPERIAAKGGSNGGILITNMLTRYPERFGALFCTIPLIDMRRYTRLLAGPSWIDEYGDPDKPEDWAFLQTYSAYHAAKPGQSYPPILIATTRKDDRVHPGHARKMTAKLQAMGYDAHLYEPAAGGHSSGKDNKEQAAFIALGFTFLANGIGWPQGKIPAPEKSAT
jgi:prolyl oligopeptidase